MRRQVAAHLGFGMLAGGDAAEDLQHHRVVDDQRAVGLLGASASSPAPRASAQDLVVAGHRLEHDLALVGFDLRPCWPAPAASAARRTAAAKASVSRPTRRPRRTRDKRELVGQRRGGSSSQTIDERHLPALRGAVDPGLDLGQQQLAVAAGQRRGVGDARRLDRSGPWPRTSGASAGRPAAPRARADCRPPALQAARRGRRAAPV